MSKNKRLKELYEEWKATFNSDGLDIKNLEPPLLLSDCEQRGSKTSTIAFVGQETLGWKWHKNYRAERTKYTEDYTFSDQFSFENFLKNNDSVDALMWAYQQFDYARYQPENHRSPFWRAFRNVQDWDNSSAIQTNLSRCAYNGKTILKYKDNKKFFAQEARLLIREIKILEPKIIIFVTGPRYDHLIQLFVQNVSFKPAFDGTLDRQIALVKGDGLPRHTYRTYHPAYLSRIGRMSDFDRLHDLILR